MAKLWTGQWYTRTGERAYGKTIKQAREEGLLPGPSAVLNIINKPAVVDWKARTTAEVASTIPVPRSDPRAFVEAVLREVDAQQELTQGRGSWMHDALQTYIDSGDAPLEFDAPDLQKLWAPAQLWADKYVRPKLLPHYTERVVVNLRLGYAGRADYIGGLVGFPGYWVLDFKTQWVKKLYQRGPRDKTIIFVGDHMIDAAFYAEFPMQGTAYAQAADWAIKDIPDIVPFPGFASVVISTNPEFPGVAMKVYTPEEYEDSWQTFMAALTFWRRYNKFPYEEVA